MRWHRQVPQDAPSLVKNYTLQTVYGKSVLARMSPTVGISNGAARATPEKARARKPRREKRTIVNCGNGLLEGRLGGTWCVAVSWHCL